MHFFLLLISAPEMLKGDVVGPPADIWSVGVLTFIMWVLISQLVPSRPSLNRNATEAFMWNEAYNGKISSICIQDFRSFPSIIIIHGMDILQLLFTTNLTNIFRVYWVIGMLWWISCENENSPLIFQVEWQVAFHWKWSPGDWSQNPGSKVWPL